MKLALGTTTYAYLWDFSLDETIVRIANMGFRYIEVISCPPHIWPRKFNKEKRRQEEIQALFDRYNLQPISVNATFLDLNLISTNPGIRKETVCQMKEQIDLAAILGAPIAVISVGKRHPLFPPSFESSWELAKKGIAELVEHATKKKVIVGLENGWSGLTEARHLTRMMGEVGLSDYLGIVFDVANSSMVEDPVIGLEKVAKYLSLVHLSDTDGKTWTHSPIGKGTIHFQSVGEKLQELEYEGMSMLEICQRENPDNAIKSSVRDVEKLGWHR